MEDASLTTKGVVKLSSAVDSTSESLAATPKAVKAANDNANSRVPSNRKVNGKALTADITLTPKDIGTLNSVTMSFSGGAGWFKLATVTMPQASSIVYIALIGGAGYNVGSPHQAGISELVLRAGNGNPKGITGALWKRTAVGLTNFAWINTSGDTYDIYVEIGNYATSVNIHWDCTANASVSVYTSPTYSASKPSSVTYGVVYTMYSSHQKPTPSDIGALPTTGGTVSGPLSVTGGLTGSLNGNASTATKLQTARSIGGVVFDGSANINLPGVNTTGNQNTTGNAATATKLQTARKISGVPFDGSTDITLTAAHVAAFARRATGSYADADGGVPWNAESGAYNVTRTGDSYILANFYTGVGSCRTLQMKAHYRNGGLFYRSSRDGYGFESGWEQVYTTGFMPQPADINAPTAAAGWLNSGNGTAFTTAQFITWLNNQGAFTNKHWIARCSWAYANNNYIDDTGCGRIDLSGSVIEVFSNKATSHYTIRVTTTTTSGHGGVNNAEFIYVYNGSDYAPGWRRSYNTRNKPTASDVGALSLSGGALTGGLTAAGEIISKSANGLRIAYGNYGFFIRNDGSSTYFMLTDSGNSLGTYNRLRPLIINNANGAVTIGNGLNVTGGINGSLNGNAATATKLQTARTIGGVSFDGSANINLPGVNIAGNQNTTGNAATATKLQTACTINGVSFDGSKNIELTAEDLNLEQTVELAAGSLQKNQNGADIPDKDRFLSNINVYSKGEVDKKKGMRQYAFNAPSNAVGGKWYPVIFRRSTGSTGELASRVIITTTSAGGNYEMNNCEFNGMVMPGGWTDRGSYAAGYFSTYQTNERAIHSIVTSLKEDDVCSVFYVEGRAFPVRVSAEEGLTVIVPTQDYTVGQTTYKWGATNPATESTNAQAILDFNNGRGFYCSHSIFGINAIFSGNLGIGTANALGGNSIVLGDNDTGFKQNGDGVLDAYANGVHVFRFRNGSAISLKGIQTGESKLFTLSSSNTAARNASFNLWGNSSRPTVAELGDDSGWHFYSQRNTDNSVIFSVNGQIQPNNWGNFDSRYVKDVRLGTRVVQLMARGGRYEKAGHAITGLRIIGEVDGDDEAIFRPIQKYINGTWYNVAQV
ncbi:TPA: tail fiber protein [Escherichia coli]